MPAIQNLGNTENTTVEIEVRDQLQVWKQAVFETVTFKITGFLISYVHSITVHLAPLRALSNVQCQQMKQRSFLVNRSFSQHNEQSKLKKHREEADYRQQTDDKKFHVSQHIERMIRNFLMSQHIQRKRHHIDMMYKLMISLHAEDKTPKS